MERAEHVRLAVLKRRAGNTEYQLQLTKLACDAVVRYVKDDKPPDDLRRRNIARAIARLKNAGSFDASAEWRKTRQTTHHQRRSDMTARKSKSPSNVVQLILDANKSRAPRIPSPKVKHTDPAVQV